MISSISFLELKERAKSLRRSGNAKPVVEVLQAGYNIWKNCKDFALLPLAFVQFKSKTEGKTVPELVTVVMTEFGGLLRPIQSPDEISRWIQRVAVANPKVIVEIGTAKGGTLWLMSRAADPSATIISIDLPGGLYGGGYPRWKMPFFRHIIGEGKTVHFLRGNSHAASTVDQVRKLLVGRPIDLLFIDGDHSYEGVKTDFNLYSPMVRPGGLIGMHDIVENRLDADIDVSRFWAEVKAKLQVEEIIDPRNLCNFGIGVAIAPEANGEQERTDH